MGKIGTHFQKYTLEQYFSLHEKISSHWVIDLKVKGKMINILENNMSK